MVLWLFSFSCASRFYFWSGNPLWETGTVAGDIRSRQIELPSVFEKLCEQKLDTESCEKLQFKRLTLSV